MAWRVGKNAECSTVTRWAPGRGAQRGRKQMAGFKGQPSKKEPELKRLYRKRIDKDQTTTDSTWEFPPVAPFSFSGERQALFPPLLSGFPRTRIAPERR